MSGKKAVWIMLTGLLFLVFLNKPAFCVTYYVPDNFPTIQAAVNACWGGETIIVRAGTYTGEGNKNITINKVITVKSEAGPENTIIDCEGVGRGFTITNVSSLALLEGFKIINGSVTGSGTGSYGGGIYCSYASTRISNCIIHDNSATGFGGGIYSQNGSPTLANCTISGNSANSQGGGIYSIGGTLTLTNCTISGNSGNNGGGIYSPNGSPTLTNCTISGNSAAGSGGGIYSQNGLTLTSSTISGNSAAGSGGGIFSSSTNPGLTCFNCVILLNSAVGSGGGIYETYQYNLTNCTFAWNSAGRGGAIASGNYAATIRNTIMYFDAAMEEIYRSAGTTTTTYSNIWGGYPGEGNIDSNPEFAVNGDFHLAASSPCIDTASPVNAPDTDIEDQVRPHGDGYDMGADEFDGIPVHHPTPSKADLNNDGAVDGLDVAIVAEEFGKTL